MPANIIEYELIDRPVGEENFIWQYDRGQKILFTNIVLPFSYEVHFANKSSGPALKVLGDSTGVVIPYDITKTGKPAYFWLYLVDSETKAVTVFGNHIQVRPRAEVPTDTPTPEEHGVIEQAIAELNAGVQAVQDIEAGIPTAIDEALMAAKTSGDFKGDPGAVYTPYIEDGIMSWTNNGELPNPDPVNLRAEFDMDEFATKQEVAGKLDAGVVGSPNGVAALDASGRVPSEQLPSYVDDVLEFASLSMFPNPGEAGKIYVSLSNNHQYRWTGSQYIDMTSTDLSTKADKRDTVLETTLSRDRKSNTTVGTGSIAFGTYNEASGNYSVAIGGENTASGDYSHAEGRFTEALAYTAHSEGNQTTSNGRASHAEGDHSKARNMSAHAEGYYTESDGTASHAEGGYTKAIEDYSHAEGCYTKAKEDFSHAEGNGSEAGGTSSHSEGYYTKANGDNSHSEGKNTIAGGDASHSEGESTISSGDNSHSEGYSTVASGDDSHAEGENSKSSGPCSHAEGIGGTYTEDETEYTSQAAGTADHIEGFKCLTQAGVPGNHAEGYQTKATGGASHAEGYGTKATGNYSHVEGNNNTASGASSHSEGSGTTASGVQSHAEGSNSIASGPQSHAEGLGGTYTENGVTYTSQAPGTADHVEGYQCLTQSGTPGNHAEGYRTKAIGGASHAEGYGTKASAVFTHTEGYYTQATAYTAHAEGSYSEATGTSSHAEGDHTAAKGSGAHSEGTYSEAKQFSSHAEGSHTVAEAAMSHAEGEYTIATGSRSHVAGRYNVADSYDSWTEWTPGESCVVGDKRKRTTTVNGQTVVSGYVCSVDNSDEEWNDSHWATDNERKNFVEIIGNGTADNERSNARATDWNGNGFFKGDVYVGCNPNSSGGTKLLKETDIVFATDAHTLALFDD